MLTKKKKKKVDVRDTVIKTIQPYRFGKAWVFDDPAVGLDKEALVAGADDICESISAILGKDKFIVQFSEIKFPGTKFHGEKKNKGNSINRGTTYFSPELKMDFWLCPALGKYFHEAPKELWVTFK